MNWEYEYEPGSDSDPEDDFSHNKTARKMKKAAGLATARGATGIGKGLRDYLTRGMMRTLLESSSDPFQSSQ
ncbi:hypothetical protein COL26b_005338 [Colletotrichum chrysophilum]|uniref:uncharacterized protein n=1 Tax=Colletotrichum chrysophilum TaxID=1836956 RepID=UPI00230128AC|nr:uncharacterized protein COL26b_005338 [Colletotrichum chrysophilum]KAJ0376524.1 hypothetical protein COL26b_005338 [Colletotrichum chrysophilum]